LSKNNNNIFRIKYLLSKFPSSKVVLMLRNPIDTAISLTKVHYKFLKLHKLNNKFSEELKLLGHEEFGYNRKLFKLNLNNKIIPQKNNYNQIKLYINKCLELNSFIVKNYSEEIKQKKIIIVDFDKIKSFEDIQFLLEKLKIKNIDLVRNYFIDNFKSSLNNYTIDRNKYEIFLDDYKTLKNYSQLKNRI